MMRKITIFALFVLTAFLSSCSINIRMPEGTLPSTDAFVFEQSPSPLLEASPDSPAMSPPDSSAADDRSVSLPPDLPQVIKNDDGPDIPLFLSVNEEKFIDHGVLLKSEVVMDFDGDGQKDTLSLGVSDEIDLNGGVAANKPVRVKMLINGCEETVEAAGVDGADLYITDFNLDDQYLDICFYKSGSGNDGEYLIYRYNGSGISCYTSFSTQSPMFSYDGRGRIYFVDKLEQTDETAGGIRQEPVIAVLDYNNLGLEAFTP